MKIGLTGVSGHLGNNVARYLIDKGYSLKGLVRNVESPAIKDLPIEIIEGDLFNEAKLNALCKEIDVLIHLAAKISIYPSERELVYKTNIEGVDKIIDAVRRNKVKKVIHVSSIHAHETYGPTIPINEQTPYVTSEHSAYDFSKSMGEQKMIALRKEGVDVCVLNPTSVFGPFDFGPSLQGKLIMDIYTGKMPIIVNGGFDWVDVRDIAFAVESILYKNISNDKFLISGHWKDVDFIAQRVMSHKNKKYKGIKMPLWSTKMGVPFVRVFSKLTGVPPLYTRESIKALEEGSKNVINDRAREILGYSPRSTDETIDDSLTWLLNNKP